MIVVRTFSISIIMPAYNVESYIGEAIDSVLSQTVAPLELIVVNDGSTDGTGQVIKGYQSNPLLKVITTDNQGLGPARNTGLEHAKGDYVYFFDSDDVLHCTFVETMSDIVHNEGGVDLVAFSGAVFTDGKFTTKFNPDYQRRVRGVYASGMELYKVLVNKRSLFPSACLYVTRRSLWAGGSLRFKSIIHEDEEILFPLYLEVRRCTVIQTVLFMRRVRENSIMTSGVSRENARGFEVALQTLMRLQEEQEEIIKQYHDLWESRMIELFAMGLNKSIMSGRLIPSRVIMDAYWRVFGIRSTAYFVYQYVKAMKRFFLD